MGAQNKKDISQNEIAVLLEILKTRFESNMHRHKGIEWRKVQSKLELNIEKLWSLNRMEQTGGEPDVIARNNNSDEYMFYDCSVESPKRAKKCMLRPTGPGLKERAQT